MSRNPSVNICDYCDTMKQHTWECTVEASHGPAQMYLCATCRWAIRDLDIEVTPLAGPR